MEGDLAAVVETGRNLCALCLFCFSLGFSQVDDPPRSLDKVLLQVFDESGERTGIDRPSMSRSYL